MIAAMSEALEATCKELGDDIGQPGVAREVIAGRIIAAAKLGERDPVRLQAAALRKSAAAKIRESGRGNSLPLSGTHSKH
jgi:hypothetical protein